MGVLTERATEPVVCATCELEVAGPAVEARGRRYCCAGCADGGPCSCTYDFDDITPARRSATPPPVAGPGAAHRPPPVTVETYRRLEAEHNRLAAAVQAAQARLRQRLRGEPADAVADSADRLRQLEYRRESLRHVLAGVELVEADGRVVLGSRVVVREQDGTDERYRIVVPADADPLAGRISYESPMGRALLRGRAGQAVTVTAPSGAREVTIVSVE